MINTLHVHHRLTRLCRNHPSTIRTYGNGGYVYATGSGYANKNEVLRSRLSTSPQITTSNNFQTSASFASSFNHKHSHRRPDYQYSTRSLSSSSSSSVSDNAADLLSFIENGELEKIREAVSQGQLNIILNANTIDSILDAFIQAQQVQLDKVLKVDDADADENAEAEADSGEDVEPLENLNDAWEITNDADDLLRTLELRQLKNNFTNTTRNANVNVTVQHCETMIQAWDNLLQAYDNNSKDSDNNQTKESTNVRKRGITQRATYHLEVMERLAMNNNMNIGNGIGTNVNMTMNVPPKIDTYNTVLRMWTKSQEHVLSSTSMAESTMRRLEANQTKYTSRYSRTALASASEFSSQQVEPNAETYRIMIRAWSRVADDVALSKRKIGNAAFNATGYLMKMQSMMEKGWEGLEEFEPDLEDYHAVFDAWGKGRYAKYSGKRALALLKKMESYGKSENEFTKIKPDVECYKNVLLAMSESKAQYLEGLGYQAEGILTRMEENALVPDTDCFRYAIQIWSNSACRNELTQKQIYEDAERVQQLLERMEAMHYRSGTVLVKPSTVDYNNVMRAWSRSSSKEAVEHVEQLLSKLETAYDNGNGDADMAPNFESYVYLIEALGRHPDVSNRINGILASLERMEKQHKAGNEACKPNIVCFNAVIAACGKRSLKSANEQEKKKALKCAIEILQNLRSDKNVPPTSRTYNLTLKAFGILLNRRSPELKKAVESVFQMCCNEGLIDDKVVKTFHRVAPHDVYRHSILSKASLDPESESASDTLFLPEEWTRNMNGIRQRIPLAVDGRFVHERSPVVSEHKMRRLRKKRNQSLLQGGRM